MVLWSGIADGKAIIAKYSFVKKSFLYGSISVTEITAHQREPKESENLYIMCHVICKTPWYMGVKKTCSARHSFRGVIRSCQVQMSWYHNPLSSCHPVLLSFLILLSVEEVNYRRKKKNS